MSTMTDERRCLHCGQTKAEIRRDDTICGIEGGYEYRELEEEWPRHRWADWSNKILAANGIRPEAFEKHRRTPITQMQWVGCEDTIRGHTLATVDELETFGARAGQCIACGYKSGVSCQSPRSAPSVA